MKPWVHYVPIRADLSDLRVRYDWAESHPRIARRISDHATELARSLGTPAGAEAIFEHFYKGRLRDVVRAYQPAYSGGDSWKKALEEADLRPFFRCDGDRTRSQGCERL